MKILILGAAGEIAKLVRDRVLKETDDLLVLFARNASTRLLPINRDRETVIDGDFQNRELLIQAMDDVDAVYLNDMGNPKAIRTIVEVMDQFGVKQFIGASVLGIYDEVTGKFGEWNNRMIGSSPRMDDQKKSAQIIEQSDLDYTLLRLTWLYNQDENEALALTQKGEPFVGAQVTRQAVTRLIMDILTSKPKIHQKESLGVSEPGSEKYDKPTFY